jgi:hypothetical protein
LPIRPGLVGEVLCLQSTPVVWSLPGADKEDQQSEAGAFLIVCGDFLLHR